MNKLKAADRRLLDNNRANYKVEVAHYKTAVKTELWRKNPKGYYNFVSYITPEDDVDLLILVDLKRPRKLHIKKDDNLDT